jgi:hypothetical protein
MASWLWKNAKTHNRIYATEQMIMQIMSQKQVQ